MDKDVSNMFSFVNKTYLFQKAQILLCQIHNFLNHPKSVPAQTYLDVSNMLGCDDRRADSLELLCPIIRSRSIEPILIKGG